MHETWERALAPKFEKPFFVKLMDFVEAERAAGPVYPPRPDTFAAFDTPLDCVRVVILGQDPYHGPGQAHGLAFSVKPGVAIPPSLANIYKELQADVGCPPPKHGCLTAWARRGVLLLNRTLTVRCGEAASHVGRGWELFTSAAVAALSDRTIPMVFILWGAHAQGNIALINKRHHIVASPHPSPLSASKGFFGSRPFSRANRFLVESGIGPVDWSLPDDPNVETPASKPVVESKIMACELPLDDI